MSNIIYETFNIYLKYVYYAQGFIFQNIIEAIFKLDGEGLTI